MRSNPMFSMIRAKESRRRHALRQAVESLEGRILLAYSIDPDFNDGGYAGDEGGRAFAIQPDNKIIGTTIPAQGGALAQLQWTGPGISKQVVPQSQFSA